MAPQTTPAIMLPAANVPYSRPLMPGCPISCVNAVSETCMPPKTDPMPRKMITSTRTPGTESADAWRSASPEPRRFGAGWVRRWKAKSSPPTSVRDASATSPAAGCSPVHSAVASTGPITKVNSSVTDSNAAAVGIRGEPSSFAAHRARTMGPICGTDAPAGTAATYSAHRGAPSSASAVSRAIADACTTTPGSSTARCPKRSASLPLCGANRAMETPAVADTVPARKYEPLVCSTSSRMPMVSIANGCRARNPGSRNVQAPRVRSNWPYPGRGGGPASGRSGERSVTVDATVRAFLPPGSAPPHGEVLHGARRELSSRAGPW